MLYRESPFRAVGKTLGYDLGKNIVDKFTKLNQKGFSNGHSSLIPSISGIFLKFRNTARSQVLSPSATFNGPRTFTFRFICGEGKLC